MLIDQVINTTETLPECEKLHDALKKAEVFVIDNVANYFWEENSQEDWRFEKDFPNLAPPYEIMWFEYSFPKFSNSNGKIINFDNPLRIRKIGTLLSSIKLKDIPGQPPKAMTDSGAKWVCYVHSNFMDISDEIIIPKVAFSYLVGDNGEAIWPMFDDKGEGLFVWTVPKEFGELSEERRVSAFGMSVSSTKPCWLALSFLHCKNVEMQNVEIPAALQRARLHRGKNPLFSYHLLNIKPMTGIIQTTASKNKTDIKKALHICRGHFKDFSKGAGLFGKYKDLYWWDAFVRGSKESGMVLKDYNVSPTEL